MLLLFDYPHDDIAHRKDGRALDLAPDRRIVLNEIIKTYPVFVNNGKSGQVADENLTVHIRFPENCGVLEQNLIDLLAKLGHAQQNPELHTIELAGYLEEVQWLRISSHVNALAEGLKTDKFRIIPALEMLAMASLRYTNNATQFSGASPLLSFVRRDSQLAIKLLYSISAQKTGHPDNLNGDLGVPRLA